MSFKKFDGNAWQPISPKKLKGIPYTGTLPATLTGTKAGYLRRYKIYGNTEQTGTPTPENPITPQECGERTENIGMLTANNCMFVNGSYTTIKYTKTGINIIISNYAANFVVFSLQSITSDMIGESFAVSWTGDSTKACKIGLWDYEIAIGNKFVEITPSATVITITNNMVGKDIAVRFYFENKGTYVISDFMLTAGSTAPSQYIPYGYKLPLTSAGQSVDIYIGNDTLSAEEYVDSDTGKIYRMVDGVLTPTDPPLPLPQIPTSANSTTISWAGEGLAPSEFDSIQEWVDIPTYKRVNGAWVDDN